jgi:hypothetical protein
MLESNRRCVARLPSEGCPGLMQTVDFHGHLGLRNSRNLLRYFQRGIEPLGSDGAAHHDTLRQR